MVEQACSVTNLLIGENLVGVSKDMDLTCHRFSTAFHPSISISTGLRSFVEDFDTQDPLGRVRWHCALQLSCYDSSLDVPHGSHLWQHLHNEGVEGSKGFICDMID